MAQAGDVEVLEDSAQIASVLQPQRMRMLRALCEPDSASGLARRLDLSRQQVNYHLRALEQAGLVRLVEERRKGNCIERVVQATARAYLISPAVLGELAASPEDVEDRFSSAYLAAVVASVLRDVAVLRDQAAKAKKRLATFTALTDVRFASAADRNRFAEELSGVLATLVAKYHDESAPDGRRFRFVVAGHPKVQ